MVRFPLLWATGVDIVESMTLNREQSTENIAMIGLIESLYVIFGKRPFTVKDLFKAVQIWEQNGSIKSHEEKDEFELAMDEIVESLVNISEGALKNSRKTGWVLKKLRNRRINNKVLIYRYNSSGNRGRYHIEEVKNNASDSTADDDSVIDGRPSEDLSPFSPTQNKKIFFLNY